MVYTIYYWRRGAIQIHGRRAAQCVSQDKRHTYIFKYTDVESVTYKPMKLFTKQKGFTVKITTKNNEVIFRYIMPANAEFFTIESTPFYILQHPPKQAEERKDR